MIDINLIAQRRQQKARTARLLRLEFYVALGLAIMLFVVYAGMTVRTWRVRAEIVQCDARLSEPRLVTALQRVSFLEKQNALLSPRVALLREVQKSQQCWVGMLQDFSQAVPPKVWMASMNSRLDPKGQNLTVAGSALSQRAVGDFMLNLGQMPTWQPPRLSFTRVTKSSSGVVDFELKLALKNPVGSNLK